MGSDLETIGNTGEEALMMPMKTKPVPPQSSHMGEEATTQLLIRVLMTSQRGFC